MKDAYSGAEAILGLIKNQRKSAQDAAVNAERLPYELTKAYRENADPKLQKSINEAEAKALSAPTEGLAKYQNIENPFTRRALADKYATSVGAEYKNLLGEQERRQGVITDYINMWSGTYGAIAKGEQMKAEALQSEFSSTMQIAGKRADASVASSVQKNWPDVEIISTINKLKSEGEDWETIANKLASAGVNVQTGSIADKELRRVHGLSTVEKTAKEVEEENYSRKAVEVGKNDNLKFDSEGNIVDTSGWFDKIVAKKPSK